MTQPECDIAIVGAGPAGLFAAYYAGFRGLSCIVVDSLKQVGGQITAMYPTKPIYDVAGHPRVTGKELVANLRAQADQFGTQYRLGTTVAHVQTETSSTGTSHLHLQAICGTTITSAGTLIVAGGVGHFAPRPHAPSNRLDGRGVDYYVTDIEAHKNRDIVVIGGGDSAVDWAMTLSEIARTVTLVHRRASFRAHAASVKALSSSGVQVITDAEVIAAHGSAVLESVTIKTRGSTQKLTCQRLIPALGFTASVGPILEWQLETEERRRIRVGSRMETTRTGVFAAGDITTYPGKVALITVGFGEAATAVNNAASYLDPTRSLAPGHSTDRAHDLHPLEG